MSDSHFPCHALTMPFFSRPWHSTAISQRPCCAVALRRTAWRGHGMASVNQTRPHCVNQMGKTHYKPLATWHGRGTACYVWMYYESGAFILLYLLDLFIVCMATWLVSIWFYIHVISQLL